MIILGHRGAAGLAPENTLESISMGISSGADIIHVDVRLTRDDVAVLLHDVSLYRTHKIKTNISALTYTQLQAALKERCPPTLKSVLDEYFGTVLLNIELRSRGSGKIVMSMLQKRAKSSQSKWDSVLISSFKVSELLTIRRLSRQANLAFLLDNNPFGYIAYHRFLKFTALGFHRLHSNKLALAIAKKAEIFTYAYTVDRPQAVSHLAELGFDGILTNYPDKLSKWLSSSSHKKTKR